MCSRYTFTDPVLIFDELGLEAPDPDLVPRFNIAPTDLAPVVVCKDGKRIARLFRFGLIPSWANDVRAGVRMLNARSETVATKAANRSAIVNRRCIVAADGFIECTQVNQRVNSVTNDDPACLGQPSQGDLF